MENESSNKTGKEITPKGTCPYFTGRKSILAIEPICWFCRYAGFDLNDDKLPEKGVCLHPKDQTGKEKLP